MPAKADPVVQKHFLDHELRPRLAEAAAGRRRVLFADAAHFVRGAFLGYLWCLVRWVVPTGCGRQRYNVLGALDAVTHELVRETNVGVVDQVTAGRLLRRIRERYPTGPITVVWDNARYQHTPLVRSLAACYRIELLYLPPYSPNLNLIERVWKFVKGECLRTKCYDSYDKFHAAIQECLDDLPTKHKDAMDTLLTHEFQTFENVSLIAA